MLGQSGGPKDSVGREGCTSWRVIRRGEEEEEKSVITRPSYY